MASPQDTIGTVHSEPAPRSLRGIVKGMKNKVVGDSESEVQILQKSVESLHADLQRLSAVIEDDRSKAQVVNEERRAYALLVEELVAANHNLAHITAAVRRDNADLRREVHDQGQVLGRIEARLASLSDQSQILGRIEARQASLSDQLDDLVAVGRASLASIERGLEELRRGLVGNSYQVQTLRADITGIENAITSWLVNQRVTPFEGIIRRDLRDLQTQFSALSNLVSSTTFGETISRLSEKSGVRATLIVDRKEGSLVKATGSLESSGALSSARELAADEGDAGNGLENLATMAWSFVKAAGTFVLTLDDEDEVKLLRLRTKKHELVIVPDTKYILVVVHDTPAA